MIITPYMIGFPADNYWLTGCAFCNYNEWIINLGTDEGWESLNPGQRSSLQSCMIGYVDN